MLRARKSPRRQTRGGARHGGEAVTSLHIVTPKQGFVKRGGLSQIVTQNRFFQERDPWDWRHISIGIELDKLIP